MLGIIGGAFDPVHYGHLRIALEAQQQLGLEAVHWIPTGQPPHRTQALASAQQRLAMLELALQGQSHWHVDRRELERQGPSYMVDTLIEIRQEQGAQRPLVLILGADAFAGLQTWSRWQQLWELAHIVVCARPGDLALPEALVTEVNGRLVTDVAHLVASPAGRLYRLDSTALDIASSQIRRQVAEGLSPRYLLPDTVLHYLAEQHLYRGL